MLKLSLKLMLLSIIFLSVSCKNVSCKEKFPEISPQERCVIVITKVEPAPIETLISEEPLLLEDTYKGYCRCQMYEWTPKHMGTIGSPTEYALDYCDKMIGFRPDAYKEVWTWWETIRLWAIRNNKGK